MKNRMLAPLVLALGAVGPVVATEQNEKLQVVTTLAYLADIARDVGGDLVEAESLVDPRQDPHYVSPTPVLMQKTRKADVYIEVGLQLELWSEKVVAGSGNTKIQMGQRGRVIASKGITTLQLPKVLSRDLGDVHPYGNPHVWLDPLNAKTMAASIATAFAAVDPENAAQYEANLADFEQRIDAALFGKELVAKLGGKKLTRLARTGRLEDYLEQRELTEFLGGWLLLAKPLAGRPIVTFHRTYTYAADRFGFDVAINIEEKPGIPPSAKQRDRVAKVMQERGVRTVMQAIYYDRSAAEYLADKAGANVVVVANDVGGDAGVESYFDLIERILSELMASETKRED